MKNAKLFLASLAVVLALTSAFTKPTVVSYWFDTNDLFVAGPSEPSTEISRINQPSLNLSTTQGTNGIMYEQGFTAKTSADEPDGINNQNLYRH